VSMRRARARRRDAVSEAGADMKCTACGRVFEGRAAFTVHRDYGQCLPDGAFGQLVQLPDKRWAERWRHPEIR
jgi:hypothetical protein